MGKFPELLSFFLELIDFKDSTAARIVWAFQDCHFHHRFSEKFFLNWFLLVSAGESIAPSQEMPHASYATALFFLHWCYQRLKITAGRTLGAKFALWCMHTAPIELMQKFFAFDDSYKEAWKYCIRTGSSHYWWSPLSLTQLVAFQWKTQNNSFVCLFYKQIFQGGIRLAQILPKMKLQPLKST